MRYLFSCVSMNVDSYIGFLIGSLMAGTGKVTAEIGRTRRALSTINQNFVGAAPYPCAVSKRGGLPE